MENTQTPPAWDPKNPALYVQTVALETLKIHRTLISWGCSGLPFDRLQEMNREKYGEATRAFFKAFNAGDKKRARELSNLCDCLTCAIDAVELVKHEAAGDFEQWSGGHSFTYYLENRGAIIRGELASPAYE